MVTSLGCCSPLPGNTCLSDVPRGATGWGAEPRGAEGAGQRVAQPGWHHGTVCLAGKPERGSWNGHQILQGIPGVSAGLCLGSWQGHAPSASGSLSHSLGFSCWGHRNQLELREAKGTGALAAATPWEGAIGGGKVTVALAATGQGQRNLTTKEGSGVGWPCPAPVQLSVSLSSVWPSPAGTPSHHQAPRLGAWLLRTARCLWKSLTVAPVPGG